MISTKPRKEEKRCNIVIIFIFNNFFLFIAKIKNHKQKEIVFTSKKKLYLLRYILSWEAA
jgi:hypothetical protein